MFLKSLTISSGAEIIRQIPFHNGINLVVDETLALSDKQTGNNVGKTTVLMLIDFCLGASAKHIYTDPENKKEEYKLVKDFLIQNEVLITLVLKSDLSNPESVEICIERNFLARKKIVRKINGQSKTEVEFEETLTNLLFPGHYGKKPTFRQIISHNIRYKDSSINNTLRTLDTFTRDDEYETLYLFLLGVEFSDGDTKQELVSKIRVEQAFKNRLEKAQTKSAYEISLAILDEEIATLEKRKSNFNVNESFESDLQSLNGVRYQINVLSMGIGKLNLRLQLINEAQADLEANISRIDLQQLAQIYKQATTNVIGIQKTFDELCVFHNKMIVEKVRYIAKDIPKIQSELQVKNSDLVLLLEKEILLATAISRSDSFEELENLIRELNEKFRKKGEYESTIQQLVDTETELGSLNLALDNIDEVLFSDEFENLIKVQINKFNRFFSKISQQLYGEQYALKFDPVETKSGRRLYRFVVFNTNFSSGKKQGEISCFDIAYTLFADNENIPCFHFLLNDKKELMHDNQLLKIAQLVKEENIQFVASILRDKLPIELNKEEYIVVKLSQDDKIFRIENFNTI